MCVYLLLCAVYRLRNAYTAYKCYKAYCTRKSYSLCIVYEH